MKKILPLLMLIGVVIFSGCVGTQPITTTGTIVCPGAGVKDGIIITDFSFDYSPVYAGESPGLNLEVQNNGGETGQLLGVDIFGPEANNPGPATDLKWGSSIILSKNDFLSTAEGELNPPDTDMGMPGGVWSNVWTLTAPTTLATDTSYTWNARVRYRYTTTFTAVLTVMSSTYLRSLPTDKRNQLIQSGGLSQQCSSGGPLLVTGAAGTHFVDPGNTPKTIRFKIDNVGNGFTYCDPNYPTDCGDNLLPATTMYHVRVGNPVAGGDYFAAAICSQDLILSKGTSTVFSCKFTAPSFTNKEDLTFSIPIIYDYYVDSAAPIQVKRSLK